MVHFLRHNAHYHMQQINITTHFSIGYEEGLGEQAH